MSHIRFSSLNSSGGSRSIVGSFNAEATWNLIATGQAGEARIEIPRGSDVLSSDYISKDGGSSVYIFGDGNVGEWFGYVDRVIEEPEKTIITANEWWSVLQHIPVQQYRIFVHVTPAVIVKTAMAASPWPLVSYAESVPDIERWEFTGESIWDHVQQMQDISGQELYYTDERTFKWGRQGGTTTRDNILVAPLDFAEASVEWDASETANQVLVLSGSQWYTARGNSLPGNRVATIKEDLTTNAMATRAENELIRRGEAQRSITGALNENHWSLQLGDSFSVAVPHANLGAGLVAHCRVISRTYNDANHSLTTRLQVLAPNQLSGVPNPLGGFGFQRRISEGRRWQLRGYRYLAGEERPQF